MGFIHSDDYAVSCVWRQSTKWRQHHLLYEFSISYLLFSRFMHWRKVRLVGILKGGLLGNCVVLALRRRVTCRQMEDKTPVYTASIVTLNLTEKAYR